MSVGIPAFTHRTHPSQESRRAAGGLGAGLRKETPCRLQGQSKQRPKGSFDAGVVFHSDSISINPVGISESLRRWTMLPRRNLILGIFLPSPVQ